MKNEMKNCNCLIYAILRILSSFSHFTHVTKGILKFFFQKKISISREEMLRKKNTILYYKTMIFLHASNCDFSTAVELVIGFATIRIVAATIQKLCFTITRV